MTSSVPISIPLFQKDEFSLDYPHEIIMPVGDDGTLTTFPTIEHYLWFLLGFVIKPNSTSTYLRSRIRAKKELKKYIEHWDHDKTIQELFTKAWKQNIEKAPDSIHKILKDDNSVPDIQCTIPKNKLALYCHWGMNFESPEICKNRLGIILKDIIMSIHSKERSSSTTTETEMVANTFCPDCESLLSIHQQYVLNKTSGKKQMVLFKCCSICDWKDRMPEEEMKQPIYATKGSKLNFKITDHDISEILLDPTLPRINNIPCVNPICPTNHLVEDGFAFMVSHLDDSELRDRITKEDEAETIGENGIVIFSKTDSELRERIGRFNLKEDMGTILKGPVKRHIVYYRTDPNNLSYSYICSTCKSIWSNHS